MIQSPCETVLFKFLSLLMGTTTTARKIQCIAKDFLSK